MRFDACQSREQVLREIIYLTLVGIILIAIPTVAAARRMTEAVKEFYRIADSERQSGVDCCARAVTYVSGLPGDTREAVARAIAFDDDWRIGCIGVSFLLEGGSTDDAVAPLAKMIGRGEEECLSRVLRSLVHSDDETTYLRVLIAVNRYLLAHLESYAGTQRAFVQQFLSGGGIEKPTTPFSRRDVERRISEWEARLRNRSR